MEMAPKCPRKCTYILLEQKQSTHAACRQVVCCKLEMSVEMELPDILKYTHLTQLRTGVTVREFTAL